MLIEGKVQLFSRKIQSVFNYVEKMGFVVVFLQLGDIEDIMNAVAQKLCNSTLNEFVPTSLTTLK